MPVHQWFVFDIGNTVIKLAYERVLQKICAASTLGRDELMEVLEGGGGYRDLERGQVSFIEFFEFLREHGGYRSNLANLRTIWTDFFDGPIDGMEDVLFRVRRSYRVAFASNSNEVHAELIPKQFAPLFRSDDRFIFSHVHKCAKPDRLFFDRTVKILGTLPKHIVFVDDLAENVASARDVGMNAYQFRDSITLIEELERDGLL